MKQLQEKVFLLLDGVCLTARMMEQLTDEKECSPEIQSIKNILSTTLLLQKQLCDSFATVDYFNLLDCVSLTDRMIEQLTDGEVCSPEIQSIKNILSTTLLTQSRLWDSSAKVDHFRQMEVLKKLSFGFFCPFHQRENIHRSEIVEEPILKNMSPSTISFPWCFDAVERAEKPETQVQNNMSLFKLLAEEDSGWLIDNIHELHIGADLLHFIEKLHLLPTSRFDLAKRIIASKKNSWVTIATNLDKFSPEEWSFDQRKEIAQLFRRSIDSPLRDKEAYALSQGVNLLGNDSSERIDIISFLLQDFSQAERSTELRDSFSRAILSSELALKEAPLEKRIELLKMILSDSEMDDEKSYHGLIDSGSLGFVEELHVTFIYPFKKWFVLITSLIALSQRVTVDLINNLDKLGLSVLPIDEKIHLLQQIAMRGEVAAERLSSSIDRIVKIGLTADQILELASFIAHHYFSAGVRLATEMISFAWMNNSAQFIKEIKRSGNKGNITAAVLIQSFKRELYFTIQEMIIDQRIDLFLFLVEQGALATHAMADFYAYDCNFFQGKCFSDLPSKKLADLFLIMARMHVDATASAMNRFPVRKFPLNIPIDRHLDLVDTVLQRVDFDKKRLKERTIWDFKDFKRLDSLEKRLQLAMILGQLSEKSAYRLAIYFSKIDLYGAAWLPIWPKVEELVTCLVSRMKTAKLYNSEIYFILNQSCIPKVPLCLELLTLPRLKDHTKDVVISNLKENIDRHLLPLLASLIDFSQSLEMEEFFKQLRNNVKLNGIAAIFERELLKQLHGVQGTKAAWMKREQLAWCTYAAVILHRMNLKEIAAIERSKLLPLIMRLRSASLRYQLLRQLTFLVQEKPSFIAEKVDDGRAHRAAIWILVSRLPSIGLSQTVCDAFFLNFCKQSLFNKRADAQKLCSFLLMLISFRPKDKLEVNLLSTALQTMTSAALNPSKEFRGKDKPSDELYTKCKQLHRLSFLQHHLLHFGRALFYGSLASKEGPEEYFAAKFCQLFPTSRSIEHLTNKYQETFGSFRDPKALYTYLRGLKMLPQASGALESLNRYVISVLEGTFQDMRYGCDDHPHLEKLFFISGVKERWLTQEPSRNVAIFQELDGVKDGAFKQFFIQQVLIDRHIDPENYPFLSAFLRGEERDHLHSLALAIEGCEMYDQRRKMILEREIIHLCSAKLHEQKSAFAIFLKETNYIYCGEEIENTIRLLKKWFRPAQEKMRLRIEESDDPCDLLLLGMEIEGSSQRVDGDPELNKGLLGYLLNGEVRLIIVKDSHGSAVANSVMRLLWDGKRPVILLERIYYDDKLSDPKIKEAILAFATQKAATIAIPLVSREVGSGLIYEKELHFLGGRAPFIHSDAFAKDTKATMCGNIALKMGGFHMLYSPERD